MVCSLCFPVLGMGSAAWLLDVIDKNAKIMHTIEIITHTKNHFIFFLYSFIATSTFEVAATSVFINI